MGVIWGDVPRMKAKRALLGCLIIHPTQSTYDPV